MSAPAFEESDRCSKCSATWTMLRRRHHCRNCGKSFCSKCSSGHAPLPHFGFSDPVRVCDGCYESLRSRPKPSSKSGGAANQRAKEASAARAAAAAEPEPEPVVEAEAPKRKEKKVTNCTCGMPLCICEPDPDSEEEQTPQKQPRKTSKPSSSPRPKAKRTAPASGGGLFFSSSSSSSKQSKQEYDMNGDLNEQCREAIKAQDVEGAKKLIEAGASVKYKDRTGNSLLHLAAMFNLGELAVLLVERGARPGKKNASGESAIDLAPTSLANRLKEMKKKQQAAAE